MLVNINNSENLVSLHPVLTAIFILNKLLLKKKTNKQIITFLSWLTFLSCFLFLLENLHPLMTGVLFVFT